MGRVAFLIFGRDFFKRLNEQINLPDEAVKVFLNTAENIEKNHELYVKFKSIIDGIPMPDCGNYLDSLVDVENLAEEYNLNKYTMFGILVIAMFERLEPLYVKNGIDKKIFFDSAADFTCKVRECMKVNGVPGTDVGRWYRGFFNLSRFALGRFQYEKKPVAHTVVFPDGAVVEEGTECLNFHIPSNGISIDDEVRYDSYKKAFEFFEDFRKDGVITFICHSWLIFPDNREFLSPDSNILRFMNDFTCLQREVKDPFKDAWRIFGAAARGPLEELPENTSLQRAVKQRMLNGKPMGMALGAFRFDGEKIF